MERHVYSPSDYERLRLKALDVLENKASTIGQRVEVYVELDKRKTEALHSYKNRLKRILDIKPK